MNQFLTNADVPVIVGMYNTLIPSFHGSSMDMLPHLAASPFSFRKSSKDGCLLVKNHILDYEPEISIARQLSCIEIKSK